MLEPEPLAPEEIDDAPILSPHARSERRPPDERWGRWLPVGVVGVACAYGLVVLHAEVRPSENLNDAGLHLSMVRWASTQIHSGRVPLNGWFPYFSLGTSEFHHYQALAAIATAYLGNLFGGNLQTTYLWLLYLGLALWPLSVYWGARLLGWGRWPAACAALVSPLLVSAPGYGAEAGSYTWRGYGLYTQLWGMWLLPLVWGLSWRAVSRGRGYALAALALALTMAFHFLTAYEAVFVVAVWGVIAWRDMGRRILRSVVVVAGAAAVAAWVLVPLLADQKWSAQSLFYKGSIFNDSYGARKILWWLVTGRLFDDGRFPIVSLLAGFGVLVCVGRAWHDERARALLGGGTICLLLYFGRPTVAFIVNHLPGNGDLQMHRFILGVHLAGIFFAGVGLATLGGAIARAIASASWPSLAAVVVGAATVAALGPAWSSRGAFDLKDSQWITAQRAADRTTGAAVNQLIDIAKAADDGRVYAGLRANWGTSYTIGMVPVLAELSNADADAIGFTFRTVTSLSTDPEASFDETNPAQYQILNVKYLLLPAGRKPSVPATLIASNEGSELYRVATTGYFQVVDLMGSVTANRATIEAASKSFLQSKLADRNIYPTVAYDGAKAAPPTIDHPPTGSPGEVVNLVNNEANGGFAGVVVANRPAAVVLKATYDPRWQVTVDGVRKPTIMIAPSLVGVDVPPGRHTIAFHYRSYPDYPLLFLLGGLVLLALALVPLQIRRVRRNVDGVLPEGVEGHDVERPLVG